VTGNPWRTTEPIPPPETEQGSPTRRLRPSRRTAALVGVGVLVAAGTAIGINFAVNGSSSPAHYARADLDCDGLDDLLAVSANGKTTGDLLFYPRVATANKSGLPSDWALPDPSYRIADPDFGVTSFVQLVLPGDLDGDGAPDVVGERSDGSMWLLPGDCHGHFTRSSGTRIAEPINARLQLTAAGDFDGDGHPDLFAVDSEDFLYLYAGTGSGGLEQPTRVAQDWTSAVGVGDVNGDGIDDVVDRRADGSLQLSEPDGSGGWRRQHVPLALHLPPSEFPDLLGGLGLTGGPHEDLAATDRMGMLVSFAATDPGPYQTSCVRVGGGWFDANLVDIAGATRVPHVPVPAYVPPSSTVQPPVPACATPAK
jgi:hypothetical protein